MVSIQMDMKTFLKSAHAGADYLFGSVAILVAMLLMIATTFVEDTSAAPCGNFIFEETGMSPLLTEVTGMFFKNYSFLDDTSRKNAAELTAQKVFGAALSSVSRDIACDKYDPQADRSTVNEFWECKMAAIVHKEFGPHNTTIISDYEGIGGFQADPQSAYVCIPEPISSDGVSSAASKNITTKFPLHVFSHGDFLGGTMLDIYENALQKVCSHGFVIVAPRACAFGCNVNQYKDILRVLDWAILWSRQTNNNAVDDNTVLQHVDFQKSFSVSGHSTGAMAVLQIAQYAQEYNIGAAVSIEPDDQTVVIEAVKNISYCPLLVAVGEVEQPARPGSARNLFDLAPPPKIFIDQAGADHMSPFSLSRGAIDVVAFLKVYQNDKQEAVSQSRSERNCYWSIVFGNDSLSMCPRSVERWRTNTGQADPDTCILNTTDTYHGMD